jgi:hypothetical protein
MLYPTAMYYNVEIGQWLNGSCCKRHRRGYKQIPGNAITAETNPLIAQYVHGSKLITFEVTDQVHGKQWDNLKLIPYTAIHEVIGQRVVLF